MTSHVGILEGIAGRIYTDGSDRIYTNERNKQAVAQHVEYDQFEQMVAGTSPPDWPSNLDIYINDLCHTTG